MASLVDDGKLLHQLRLELDILDRVLYRHTNQHRRSKYFKQLKLVRKRARSIANGKKYCELDASEIKYAQDLAVSAAETFTVLLGRSYFMPFALVCISLLAKIVSILQPIQQAVLDKKKPNVMSSTEIQGASAAKQKTLGPILGEKLHASEQDSKSPTLNTSIDFLFSDTYASNKQSDLDQKDALYEKKRKKKKKKKKGEKKKRRKATDHAHDRDAIDDIFGF